MDFRKSKTGVPILSKVEIDNIALKFVAEYDASLIEEAKPVPIEDIIETHLKLELDFKAIDRDGKTLGLISFNKGLLNVYDLDSNSEEIIKVSKGTVIIDSRLAEDNGQEGRFRFTCSHEASHWILHKHMFVEDENQKKLFDTETTSGTIKCRSNKIENIFLQSMSNKSSDDDWLEWQADYLGGAILLPQTTLVKEFFKMLRLVDINRNYLFIDKQPCNIKNYNIVITSLANLYNVSKKAVEVRLYKMGLIKYPTNQQFFSQF